MSELEHLKLETVKFMRGKYRLDEAANGENSMKFKQGAKTILTVEFHADKLVFLVIFGKAEREKFEALKDTFSPYIQNYYEKSKTYHDGKWMFIKVTTPDVFNEVKRLIQIKKKPNRKPFAKEAAVYGKCGHRCNLCVHYSEITEDFRDMLIPRLTNVYGAADWSMRCTGCDAKGCQCYQPGSELCAPLKCLGEKKLKTCFDCKDYPCEKATVGYRQLESKTYLPTT